MNITLQFDVIFRFDDLVEKERHLHLDLNRSKLQRKM